MKLIKKALNTLLATYLATSLSCNQPLQHLNLNPIEKYVGKLEQKERTNQRNVYFIFQIHPSINSGMIPKDEEEFINKNYAFPNQTSIYRILEHLHKKEDLQVVCCEGVKYHEKSDIERPNSFQKRIKRKGEDFPSLKRRISEEDSFLEKQIIDLPYLGAQLYCLVDPETYLVGFEYQKMFDSHKSIIEEHQRSGKINMRKIKDMITTQRIKRSKDALNYAISHSDLLYKKGITTNKDVAIVIGQLHDKDYQNLKSDTTLNFNPIFIYPKNNKRKN